VSELASSARYFAGERPIILRRVQSAQAQLAVPTGVEAAHFAVQTEIMEFSALARRALTAEFDLCQFEFSAQAWQRNRNNLKRWRVPIGLAAACVIVGLACLNLDWLLLSRERGELQSRANEMLLASFPNTKVVLDAPLQMRRELDAQRSRIGEPEAGDFVVLCDQLARALGPLGPNAVATVDYADHALTVGFAPGVVIDPHWAERLASVGLKAQAAAGKWVVRSAS
jgi:general secretion pathway protein L